MVSASNLVMYITMTYRTKDNIVRAGCALSVACMIVKREWTLLLIIKFSLSGVHLMV